LNGTSREPVQQTVRLDAKTPEARISVEVPAGATALRIAMNAEDDGAGTNQFQFAAFSGKDPAASQNACKDSGTGQFAFCAIDKPAAGAWTIAVTRKKGQGDVQITALPIGPEQ
jgi:hypothetical protein